MRGVGNTCAVGDVMVEIELSWLSSLEYNSSPKTYLTNRIVICKISLYDLNKMIHLCGGSFGLGSLVH